MHWLTDPLHSAFFRRALLEGVILGALGGIVGVHVVLRRLPFLTLALGHATFPGLVVAELAGAPLLLGAGGAGLLFVIGVTLLGQAREIDETSAIGVVLAGAFGLGVLLLSSQNGFTRDLTAFVAGSIVTVRPLDLVVTALVGGAVVVALAAFHKELVLVGFDRDQAEALGYRVAALDFLLLVAVGAAVVVALPAVGVILAVALLAGPAATARLVTQRVVTAMFVAAGIGMGSAAVGLYLSDAQRIAAGPAVVLVVAAVFVGVLTATSAKRRTGR